MKPINKIMIYIWDKKFLKNSCPESWNNNNKKSINLMSLAQRKNFSLGVFQVTTIVLVTVLH